MGKFEARQFCFCLCYVELLFKLITTMLTYFRYTCSIRVSSCWSRRRKKTSLRTLRTRMTFLTHSSPPALAASSSSPTPSLSSRSQLFSDGCQWPWLMSKYCIHMRKHCATMWKQCTIMQNHAKSCVNMQNLGFGFHEQTCINMRKHKKHVLPLKIIVFGFYASTCENMRKRASDAP